MCENSCNASDCPEKAENVHRPSWLKRKLSEMKWRLIHIRNRWKKSSMELWAEREIEIAVAREMEADKKDAEEHGRKYNPKEFSYGGEGSDFDFPILKAYLDAYDLATPWPYWTQRDYRTLQAVFPFIKAAEKNGEKHNALEDAQAQMRGLITFMSLEAIFKEKPKNINKVTG